VVALRDPRDMLLHWLAFGATQGILASDPVRAAAWLALALEQVAFAQQHDGDATLVLRLDALDADPQTPLVTLQRFVSGDDAAPPAPSAAEVVASFAPGPDELAGTFPAGHWQRYRGVLAEAFAQLDDIAARLGY
jgi:hypothetical protein